MKLEDLSKEKLVSELKKYMPIENNKIKWADLCFFTKFDSFATALSFGITWEEDLDKIKLSHLRMALFNIVHFPNSNKENNNSRKAGYGKSQSRIDFLRNYKYVETNL